MKKKLWRRIIFLLALGSAAISVATGYVYYSNKIGTDGIEVNGPFRALTLFILGVRNAISGFFFTPSVTVDDAFNVLKENQILAVFYFGALVVAPLCTISAIGHHLRKLIIKFKNIFIIGEPMIAVFGNTEQVLQFLKNDSEKEKLKIWAVVEEKGEQKELELLRKNVEPHFINVAECSDADFNSLMKDLNLKKCKEIYLMYPSATVNLALYLRLNHFIDKASYPDIRIYCRCDQQEVRTLFHNYYNSHSDQCIAPKIFDLKDMRADSLTSKRKLDFSDVCSGAHILIVGLGDTGKHTLYRLINNVVVSPDNPIEIDVVDYDIDNRMDSFLCGFDAQCVSVKDHTARIEPYHADGELIIHFQNLQTGGKQFGDFLDQNADGYQYAAICIEDTLTCIQCVEQFSNYVKRSHIKPFPVAACINCDPELLIMINKDQGIYSEIYFTGTDHYFNRDMIRKAALEEAAQSFHWYYQTLSPQDAKQLEEAEADNKQTPSAPKTEEDWAHCFLYQQESSRMIAAHQSMVHQILANELKDQKDELLNQWFGPNGSILKLKNGKYIIDKEPKELVEAINNVPFLRRLGAMEHRRWCYMTIFTGWHYAAERNKETKETPYLLNWDELCKQKPDVVIYDLMPLLYEMQAGKEA